MRCTLLLAAAGLVCPVSPGGARAADITLYGESRTDDISQIDVWWESTVEISKADVYVQGLHYRTTTDSRTTIKRLVPHIDDQKYRIKVVFDTVSAGTQAATVFVNTGRFRFPSSPDTGNYKYIKDSDFLTYVDSGELKLVDGRAFFATTSPGGNVYIFRSRGAMLEDWDHYRTVPNKPATREAPTFFYNREDQKYYLVAQSSSGARSFYGLSAASVDDLDFRNEKYFWGPNESRIGKTIDIEIIHNGSKWIMAQGAGRVAWAESDSPISGYVEKELAPLPGFHEGVGLLPGASVTKGLVVYGVTHGNPNDKTLIAVSPGNTPSDMTVVDKLWLDTGPGGAWDDRARGHGDIAWHEDGFAVSYQGYDGSGKKVATAVLYSANPNHVDESVVFRDSAVAESFDPRPPDDTPLERPKASPTSTTKARGTRSRTSEP